MSVSSSPPRPTAEDRANSAFFKVMESAPMGLLISAALGLAIVGVFQFLFYFYVLPPDWPILLTGAISTALAIFFEGLGFYFLVTTVRDFSAGAKKEGRIGLTATLLLWGYALWEATHVAATFDQDKPEIWMSVFGIIGTITCIVRVVELRITLTVTSAFKRKNDLAAAAAEAEKYRQTIATLEAENRQANAALESNRQTTADLEEENRKLVAAFGEENRNAAAALETNRQTVAALETNRQTVAALEAANRQTSAALEENRQRIATLETEKRQANAALESVRRTLAALQEENRQTTAALEAATRQPISVAEIKRHIREYYNRHKIPPTQADIAALMQLRDDRELRRLLPNGSWKAAVTEICNPAIEAN